MIMATSPPPAPGRIFISYRREETAYPAGWLFDRLADRYGGDQVFKDVDSIELGDDFVEVITAAVGSCDVLLALIGDRWITITDEAGQRRLDDPNDFVRVEIEAALTRNVRVIPILVEGARMPRVTELPDSLAGLVRRQALELSPTRFDFDTGRLLKVLDKTLAEVRTAQQDAALTTAPAKAAPDAGTTEVQQAPRQREQPERTPPPSTPPVPATPAATRPPPEQTKPPEKQRRRPSTRARVLAAAGVGIALILLIGIAVNSLTTSPSTQAASSTSSPTTSNAVSSATSPPTGTVIFRDSFADRAAGWEDLGPGSVGGHYVAGAYRMRIGPKQYRWDWPGDASVYPSAGPRVRIDVKARAVLGSDQGAYGIVCRANKTSAYTFEVGENNHVWIEKATTSKLTQLDYKEISAVKTNAANTIQAACTSSTGEASVHLVLWVNGQLVAEATDKDHPLQTGTVGLFVLGYGDVKKPIETQFDDLVVIKI
jgi:TIR domain